MYYPSMTNATTITEDLRTAVRIHANAIADNGVKYYGTVDALTSHVADRVFAEMLAWSKVCDPTGENEDGAWDVVADEVRRWWGA